MDDDSQLLERVKEVGTAVWTVVGLLTGSPSITTGDAIAPRLMLSHDELKRIRSSVQSIGFWSGCNRCCRGSVRVASLVGT